MNTKATDVNDVKYVNNLKFKNGCSLTFILKKAFPSFGPGKLDL